jgi:hypothetical protein
MSTTKIILSLGKSKKQFPSNTIEMFDKYLEAKSIEVFNENDRRFAAKVFNPKAKLPTENLGVYKQSIILCCKWLRVIGNYPCYNPHLRSVNIAIAKRVYELLKGYSDAIRTLYPSNCDYLVLAMVDKYLTKSIVNNLGINFFYSGINNLDDFNRLKDEFALSLKHIQ